MLKFLYKLKLDKSNLVQKFMQLDLQGVLKMFYQDTQEVFPRHLVDVQKMYWTWIWKISSEKHIFNISLAKGVFPDKLKIARLTPIFKKGNNKLVTNYRPISVLTCFSKQLERIMYNCLYRFFVENNIIYKKQFGFQNAYST